MALETIKIDNTEYEVPKVAAELCQKLVNDKNEIEKQLEIEQKAHLIANKQIGELEYILGNLISGKTIQIDRSLEMKALGSKMKAEWETEVKFGMAGWIQANWSKLCHISCDCGALISYEVLRNTNELKCNKCYETESKQVRKT